MGNWDVTTVDNTTKSQTSNEMNEYLSFDSVPQTHDDNGNLVDDGERVFAWDFANRLVSVARKDGEVIAEYRYDAFNRRISKKFTRITEIPWPKTDGAYTSDTETIALYHFDEVVGPILDSSGNGNDTPAPKENKVMRKAEGLWNSYAVAFLGGTIKSPHTPALDTIEDSLTVECWVYLQPKRGEQGINGSLIERGNSFRLEIDGKDHRPVFTLHTEAGKVVVGASAGLPLFAWLHLGAKYDGKTASLYLNGNRIAESPASGFVQNPKKGLEMGGPVFYGKLDEVRVSRSVRFNAGPGEIIRKSVVQTAYYDISWRCLEERERVGKQGELLGEEVVTRQYVDGGGIDEHLTQSVYDENGTSVEKTLYYGQNSRGDVVALTDEAGETVLRLQYSPYGQISEVRDDGKLTAFENAELVTYTFQGRRIDSETGLMEFRNRYYSPVQGRFLSRDPLGYGGGGMGLFEAFGGNPISSIDPWGLDYVKASIKEYEPMQKKFHDTIKDKTRAENRKYLEEKIVGHMKDIVKAEGAAWAKEYHSSSANVCGQFLQAIGSRLVEEGIPVFNFTMMAGSAKIERTGKGYEYGHTSIAIFRGEKLCDKELINPKNWLVIDFPPPNVGGYTEKDFKEKYKTVSDLQQEMEKSPEKFFSPRMRSAIDLGAFNITLPGGFTKNPLKESPPSMADELELKFEVQERYPENSFQRIGWTSQTKVLRKSDSGINSTDYTISIED